MQFNAYKLKKNSQSFYKNGRMYRRNRYGSPLQYTFSQVQRSNYFDNSKVKIPLENLLFLELKLKMGGGDFSGF